MPVTTHTNTLGKSRRPSFRVVFVFAVCVIVLAWFALERNMSLLSRGRRVAVLQGSLWSDWTAPQWVSDHEAIYLVYDQAADRFEFVGLNADTGMQRPMTGLNLTFARQLAAMHHNSPPRVGPPIPPIFEANLARVLIVPIAGGAALPGINVLPADVHLTHTGAKSDLYWKGAASQIGGFRAFWLPDNTRFILPTILNGRATGVTLYNASQPLFRARTGAANAPAANWFPIGVTKDNRLWGIYQPEHLARSVNVCEWDMLGSSPPQSYSIHMPAAGELCSLAFSPGRNRIAWLLEYEGVGSLQQRLNRLFGVSGRERMHTYAIWTSDLQGGHMEQLGHEDVKLSDAGIGFLRWTPDGKRISFLQGNTLYTIPVER